MNNILLENILREGTAADKAHKLGLVFAGWGKWKNKQGKVVAKTVGDKLVSIKSQARHKTPVAVTRYLSKDSNRLEKRMSRVNETNIHRVAKKTTPIGEGNINHTEVITLHDGTKVVRKRNTGRPQALRADILYSEQNNREAFSYGFYKMFRGFSNHLLHPVVTQDKNGINMQFLSGFKVIDEIHPIGEYRKNTNFRNAAIMLATFDHILNNTDRHYGNYMVNKRGEIAAIDNGLILSAKDIERHYSVTEVLGKLSKYDIRVLNESKKIAQEVVQNIDKVVRLIQKYGVTNANKDASRILAKQMVHRCKALIDRVEYVSKKSSAVHGVKSAKMFPLKEIVRMIEKS